MHISEVLIRKYTLDVLQLLLATGSLHRCFGNCSVVTMVLKHKYVYMNAYMEPNVFKGELGDLVWKVSSNSFLPLI